MQKIKFNKVGKILSGEDTGSFIKVIDDTKNTGGYLILTSTNEAFDGKDSWVYDEWIENLCYLEKFFDQPNLIIEWIN